MREQSRARGAQWNCRRKKTKSSNTNWNDYVRLRNIKFGAEWPIEPIIHRQLCTSECGLQQQQKKTIIKIESEQKKCVHSNSGAKGEKKSTHTQSNQSATHWSWFLILISKSNEISFENPFLWNVRQQREAYTIHTSATRSPHTECIWTHLDTIPFNGVYKTHNIVYYIACEHLVFVW